MLSFPSRSPNAKQTCEVGLAAKVPDLIPFGCSIVEMTLSSPLVSCVIQIKPVAFGRSPQATNLLVSGIHFTSQGVQLTLRLKCSIICGALIESILNQFKLLQYFPDPFITYLCSQSYIIYNCQPLQIEIWFSIARIATVQITPVYKIAVNSTNNTKQIKIEESMIDRKLEKLKYQTSVHHRQNLRNHIDQNMIDQIQISRTPSLNYQKAYQSLYYDQLQKSVHLHDQKKNLEETKKIYDTLVAREHQNIYATMSEREPFKNSMSAINIPNLNYRDVDYMNYDLLKETKALDHTLKNYDGGQGFYKNSDIHLQNKQLELQNMRKTLLKQLSRKQQEKLEQEQKKREEQFAIKNGQAVQNYYRSQAHNKLLEQKMKHRDEIVNQIQEQRIKRGRRSIFNYNNIARHNPITNPIEYHIDNPYILKQIQNHNRQSQDPTS